MGNPSFFFFHWFSHRIKIPSLAALEKTRLVLFPMYRHLQNTLSLRETDGWKGGKGKAKRFSREELVKLTSSTVSICLFFVLARVGCIPYHLAWIQRAQDRGWTTRLYGKGRGSRGEARK